MDHVDDGRHDLDDVATAPTFSTRRGQVLAIIGALIAILVVVRIASAVSGPFGGGDDAAPPTSTAPPTTTAVTTPDPFDTDGETGPDDGVDEARPLRDANPSAGSPAVFLSDRFGDYRIVYESATGLGIVGDDVAAIIDPVRVEAFAEITGFELFSSRGRTWAIDPTDPLSVFLVTKTNVLVETATPGNYAFVDYTSQSNDGRPLLGFLASGLPGPSLDVPEDSTVLPVDDFGVLLADDSGTSVLRGGALERLTDHRVIAAHDDARVELRCNDGACLLVLLSATDTSEPLERVLGPAPAPRPTEAVLSPNLEWLILPASGGLSEVWNLDDRFASSIPVAIPDDASWAPDSSFFSWVDRGRLMNVFPATGEIEDPTLPFDAVDGAVKILAK